MSSSQQSMKAKKFSVLIILEKYNSKNIDTDLNAKPADHGYTIKKQNKNKKDIMKLIEILDLQRKKKRFYFLI